MTIFHTVFCCVSERNDFTRFIYSVVYRFSLIDSICKIWFIDKIYRLVIIIVIVYSDALTVFRKAGNKHVTTSIKILKTWITTTIIRFSNEYLSQCLKTSQKVRDWSKSHEISIESIDKIKLNACNNTIIIIL